MDLHSGLPFWIISNGLLKEYPCLGEDARADVLVLGGGVSGAMVASRLAEEGLDVIVLDRREIATGSTCASTALLIYELDMMLTELRKKRGRDDADATYRVSHETLLSMPQWMERAGGAEYCGFRRKPSFYMASRRGDAGALRDEAEARKELGLSCELMDSRDIEEAFGFKAPLGLWTPEAAECDPYRLTHGLLKYAAGKGARIFDRTTVETVTEDKEGVTARTVDGFTVRAKKVVFATGYESQQYLKKPVASITNTFALISDPIAEPHWWREQAHIWETARPYVYIRTTPDGRILIGGEDEKFVSEQKRDAHLAAKVARLQKKFSKLFPKIDMKTGFCWTGSFAETPDSMPRIGRGPNWDHGYFALGYGGNGITFSAMAADILTGEITGRPHPQAETFAF